MPLVRQPGHAQADERPGGVAPCFGLVTSWKVFDFPFNARKAQLVNLNLSFLASVFKTTFLGSQQASQEPNASTS